MNPSQDAASAPYAGDNDAAENEGIREALELLARANEAELIEALTPLEGETRLQMAVRFKLMKDVYDEEERRRIGQTTEETETERLQFDTLLREIGTAPMLKLFQAVRRLTRQEQYNAAIAAQLILRETRASFNG